MANSPIENFSEPSNSTRPGHSNIDIQALLNEGHHIFLAKGATDYHTMGGKTINAQDSADNLNLAVGDRLLGNYQADLSRSDNAVRLDPNNADNYFERANAERELGKSAQAGEDYLK